MKLLQLDKISQQQKNLAGNILLLLSVALVFYLRFRNYLHAPSLMLDEANLALNIAERTFAQLWQPLDYNQYAPPLFLSLVKLLTLVFGLHEFTLRAVALMSSLLGLFLIYKIGKHHKLQLSNIGISIVIMLYGFSYLSLLQSNMLKQYQWDLFLALAFVYWSLKTPFNSIYKLKNTLLWTVAGGLYILSSMPSVFILTAIGLYFFLEAVENNQWKKFLFRASPVAFIWLAIFAWYFFSVLKNDAQSDYLQNYHQDFFFNPKLWLPESWTYNWSILKRLIQDYVGQQWYMITWFILFFITGAIQMLRKKTRLTLLLLLPFLLAVLASFLNYYSFIPRLLLFTIPLLFLIAVFGFEHVLKKSPLILRTFLIITAVAIVWNMNGWSYIDKDRYYCLVEETKEAALDLLPVPKNTKVFVSYAAVPTMHFYTKHYVYKEKFEAYRNFTALSWNQSMQEQIKLYHSQHPKFEVVSLWGHSENHIISASFDKIINDDLINLKAKKDFIKWRARSTLWAPND